MDGQQGQQGQQGTRVTYDMRVGELMRLYANGEITRAELQHEMGLARRLRSVAETARSDFERRKAEARQ